MIECSEVAKQYFECVVDPAVNELLDEYNAREGYEARVHAKEFLTKNDPGVSEVHGIYIIFPDSTRRLVSVCWPEGTEIVLIGVPGEPDEPLITLDMTETDKEELKEAVRELIDRA